jgi:AcrR family transcriptional regulator
MSDPMPVDLRTDSGAMHERVLVAARECVERYGLAKTAMEDVAKVAGVSRPTVYRYLGDRNNLVRTLILDRAQSIIADVRQVIAAQTSLEGRIVEGILRLVDLSRNDPYLGALVSQEHLDLAARVVGTAETMDLKIDLWMPVLRQARSDGELRTGLNLLKACEWIAQVEFIMVARAETMPRTRRGQRDMLRSFLLPCLIPDPADTPH